MYMRAGFLPLTCVIMLPGLMSLLDNPIRRPPVRDDINKYIRVSEHPPLYSTHHWRHLIPIKFFLCPHHPNFIEIPSRHHC